MGDDGQRSTRVSAPRYDSAVDLVVGARKLDRTLQNVEALVDSYRTDGLRYLDYRPLTPPGRMVPEDLTVTINSRVAGTAFRPSRTTATRSPWTRSRALPSRTRTTANSGLLREQRMYQLIRQQGPIDDDVRD